MKESRSAVNREESRKMERDPKKIIQDYRESSAQIRAIIAEYEATEHRLFKVMLDKLQAASDCAYSAEIYSELEGALE